MIATTVMSMPCRCMECDIDDALYSLICTRSPRLTLIGPPEASPVLPLMTLNGHMPRSSGLDTAGAPSLMVRPSSREGLNCCSVIATSTCGLALAETRRGSTVIRPAKPRGSCSAVLVCVW